MEEGSKEETMSSNDAIEWRLIDTDLNTTLGILPAGPSHLYLELNQPGSGEVKVPLESKAAALVTSAMFVQAIYRGAVRGGFFVENINRTYADANEGGGQWLSMSGRGALALLDDAIVWDDGLGGTKRKFKNYTRADILIILIEEAKSRGALSNLTYDFTALVDSLGVAWSKKATLQLTVGTSMLDVVRDFAKAGIDFDIVPGVETFVLRAFQNGLGVNRSESVYFRVGTNCKEVSGQEVSNNLKNALRVKYGDDGAGGSLSLKDCSSISTHRRREGMVDADNAGSSDSAQVIGLAELEGKKEPKRSVAVKMFDGVSPRAFVDYSFGDRITLDVRGDERSDRIVGLQLDWDGNTKAGVTVDLNSIIVDNEIAMAQAIRDLQERMQTSRDANLLDAAAWFDYGAEISTESIFAPFIWAIRVVGDNVYVAGNFSVIGNVPANNVAVYNTTTCVWTALGDGVPGIANALEVIGTDVYVSYNYRGSHPIVYAWVAKWNGATWTTIREDEFGEVYCSAVLGTDLLIAGNITSGSFGNSGFAVRRWNGSAWSDYGKWVDGKIYAIAVDADTSNVYIGGEFTHINGYFSTTAWVGTATANRIARLPFGGTDWETLGSPNGVTGGNVLSIAVQEPDVYVGGNFTTAGGAAANQIAKYIDGDGWYVIEGGIDTACGDESSEGLGGFPPDLEGNVLVRCNVIVASAFELYIGGRFLTAGGTPANYVARWNGTNWEPLQQGVPSECFSLAMYNTDVYTGGSYGGQAYLTTFDSVTTRERNGYVHPNHFGDVVSDGDRGTTIQPNVVTNQKLADMPTSTLKGRISAATGDPEDLSILQARALLHPSYVGNAGKVLGVNAGEDDVEWIEGGGGAPNWGDIGGLLSDQADLQSALNEKAAEIWPDVLSILSTDNGGHVTSNPKFAYDPLNNAVVIGGDVLPSFTNVPGVQAVSNGGASTRFRAILFQDTITVGPGLMTARSRGTMASPTKVTANTMLGQWQVLGTYDTSGLFASSNATIYAYADADWSSTSRPVRWEIYVTPSGSTTQVLALTIGSDGKVTLGTGGVNIPSGKTYDINGSPHTHTPAEIGAVPNDGWTAYTAVTPTRTAADDPTYTIRFSGVDLTGVLQEGMPIKWTQNSIVRYGWISSSPSLSSGNTSITVLTRLDSSSSNYDVLDTATYSISNFAYGRLKQPGFGFPIDREKWTLLITDTTDRTQSSPTAGTYYQPGSLGITVPIGQWRLGFVGVLSASVTNLQVSMQFILSTTTNSISDGQLAGYQISYGTTVVRTEQNVSRLITLASKTSYNLLVYTGTTGVASLSILPSSGVTTKIYAECTYL